MTNYYYLPDFITGMGTYKILIRHLESHSEALRENVAVGGIFGCPTNCIWNGGVLNTGSVFYTKEALERIAMYYKIHHVPLQLTFTNSQLADHMIYDTYSNLIAQIFEDELNEVLVVSPILEEYIREKYPKYKIVRSIIGTDSSPYDIDGKYYHSVLDRKMNHNYEFLNTIPHERRGTIELLVNEGCKFDCEFQYSHYKAFGKDQINFCQPSFQCPHKTEFVFKNMVENSPSYISPEDILTIYNQLGFNRFKVSGRLNPSAIIENIVFYLYKYPYQRDVRILMSNALHC